MSLKQATAFIDQAHAAELPEGPVGLLSDAHADAETARMGVRTLVGAGAQSLLYLGDVCGVGVIDALAGVTGAGGEQIPARLVFGNMDDDIAGMTRYAESLGISVDHPCGVYRSAGQRLIATHGHLGGYEEAAVGSGADWFLHGHTHKIRDELVRSTRCCNPGALHRATRYTVALLDCAASEFRVLEIEP